MRHENQEPISLTMSADERTYIRGVVRSANARLLALGRVAVYLKDKDVKGNPILKRLTAKQALKRYRNGAAN